MIKCEGIKAFHGKAVIRPKNSKFPPFEMFGDWVYKSEAGCWYCKGNSFPEDIVTDIQEVLYSVDLVEEIEARIDVLKNLVVDEENMDEVRNIIQNVGKWLEGFKAKVNGGE